VPGRPDIRAQELYARTHEWALADDDVLRRRTTAWLQAAVLGERSASR
jgi:glycerol-3-phosphate dehydrogenase